MHVRFLSLARLPLAAFPLCPLWSSPAHRSCSCVGGPSPLPPVGLSPSVVLPPFVPHGGLLLKLVGFEVGWSGIPPTTESESCRHDNSAKKAASVGTPPQTSPVGLEEGRAERGPQPLKPTHRPPPPTTCCESPRQPPRPKAPALDLGGCRSPLCTTMPAVLPGRRRSGVVCGQAMAAFRPNPSTPP